MYRSNLKYTTLVATVAGCASRGEGRRFAQAQPTTPAQRGDAWLFECANANGGYDPEQIGDRLFGVR